MTGAWTKDELERIAAAEELELAAARPDGPLRRPTTIWVVRVDDDLYVRSVRGPESGWFRSTQRTHEGHVSAGGVEKDVRFVNAEDDVDGAVDDAYRRKYERYGERYVEPMTRPQARATTIRLAPRIAAEP